MAYNSSYEESDIAEATINTLVKALITVGTLVTVIVVVMLYAWIKKKF